MWPVLSHNVTGATHLPLFHVRACVRACACVWVWGVRACMHSCVRESVRACVRACAYVTSDTFLDLCQGSLYCGAQGSKQCWAFTILVLLSANNTSTTHPLHPQAPLCPPRWPHSSTSKQCRHFAALTLHRRQKAQKLISRSSRKPFVLCLCWVLRRSWFRSLLCLCWVLRRSHLWHSAPYWSEPTDRERSVTSLGSWLTFSHPAAKIWHSYTAWIGTRTQKPSILSTVQPLA